MNTLRPDKTGIGATALLMGLALLFAYPFLWMFFSSFKPNDAIFQPWPLWPETFQWQSYRALLGNAVIPFGRQFANTAFIAGMQTLLALALCSMAGFVLAHYRFKFRSLIVVAAISVIVLPRQAMILPLFTWMNHLRLLDTPWSVILPGAVSGIGLLFFWQAWRRIPEALLHAARVEGAGEGRIFLTLLPLMKPTALAYGLIHFVFAWQEHLIPLIMLNSKANLTLGISLATLNSSSLHTPYSFLMAASTLAVLPAAAAFVLLFRPLRSALAEMTGQ